MLDGILGMSSAEQDRANVIRQTVERVIPQRVGAERLSLSLATAYPIWRRPRQLATPTIPRVLDLLLDFSDLRMLPLAQFEHARPLFAALPKATGFFDI